MRIRHLLPAVAFLWVLTPSSISSQEPVDLATTAQIKEEGLERSQALDLFLTLTDAYGGRLTGSPEYDAAAGWARDKFAEWGLAEPRLEGFDFGRGWTLEKLSVEMTAPRYMPLIAYAQAWTPSIPGVVEGPVVYLADKTEAEIAAMLPSLRGAIVLTRPPQSAFRDADRPQPGLNDDPVRTGNPSGVGRGRGGVIVGGPQPASGRQINAAVREAGAAVTITPTEYRDGTVGVLGSRNTTDDAIPELRMAAEQYNMLARLAAGGTPPEMRIELRARYEEEDNLTYNVLGDIPGTDPALADEIVLVGAHLDSWHSSNGATDNGDGAIAIMEAARILAALDVQPRRTIRFALWSGEEQGLMGANAYIDQHLPDEASREKLAVYLNDDPGSGASFGFYMEDNEAAKAIFDAWLEPLRDIGARRNIIEGIGSTDHVPFVRLGLPAFNVVKDFDAYDVRTRHTNADFPERMSEEELQRSAIFMAHFAWQAAMRDERIPGGG